MRYTAILAEKGIRTAEVDQAARGAIIATMRHEAKKLLSLAVPDWQSMDPHVAVETAKKSVDGVTIRAVSGALTNALEEVTERVLVGRFKRLTWSGILIRPVSEGGDGWFDTEQIMIVLQPTLSLLTNGIAGAVEQHVIGEDTEKGLARFLAEFLPIFTHEYAHLEQFIRAGSKWRDGRTLLPAGGPRRAVDIEPKKSEKNWLRYKGTVHEIDAFAAQAASQIMLRLAGGRGDDWNWRVRSAQRLNDFDIHDTEVGEYRQILRSAFDKAYPVKPDDARRVWARFIRKVYLKLEDYLRPQAGKATDEDTAGLRPEWMRIYKTESRIHAFNYIAHDVAKAIRLDHPDMPIEKVHALIDDGDSVEEQGMAEDFIRKVYFGGWQGDPAEQDRAVALFRQLLKRRVR